jgi:hypothetical protein
VLLITGQQHSSPRETDGGPMPVTAQAQWLAGIDFHGGFFTVEFFFFILLFSAFFFLIVLF